MAKAWAPAPKPLDVVWCNFPEQLAGKAGGPVPGPKPRPALVLEVDERAKPTYVKVAFGTSKKTAQLYSGEFQIAPADGQVFKDSGCDDDTKFDLRRTAWLPFEDTWFGPKPNGKSPVIGRIDITMSDEVKRRLRAAVEILAKEIRPEPVRAASAASKK